MFFSLQHTTTVLYKHVFCHNVFTLNMATAMSAEKRIAYISVFDAAYLLRSTMYSVPSCS
jgi:hypothetical protein